MVFNSIEFIIFFPIVLLGYFLLPNRIKTGWLLLASLVFYASWNVKYTLLLASSILVTYLSGLIISKSKTPKVKKAAVVSAVVINLLILAFFKYLDLLFAGIGDVLEFFGGQGISNPLKLILPVGISFYTFQAVGYTVDVYRGRVDAEPNLLRYALFVSFFPQLVAGPIERTENLLSQIKEMERKTIWSLNSIVRGAYTMLYGYVLKMIVADRAAILVNTVFDGASGVDYAGFEILLAAVLFSIQIYGDFAGYTYIAIGAARVMGVEIRTNFMAPYLSESIKEFWERWHISLTSWFRDYLYIPLGGSRKGKLRKYINIMLVFLLSGLWHGAAYHFIFWGFLHGVLRLLGELTFNVRERLFKTIRYNRNTVFHRMISKSYTFFAVTICWVFFRAQSVKTAFGQIGRMFSGLRLEQLKASNLFNLGLDAKELIVLLIFVIFMVAVDICIKNKKELPVILSKKSTFINFALFLAGIIAVVIFGVYGASYDASQFIYFQF